MRKTTPGSGSNQGPQATLAVMSLSLFSPLSSSNVSAFCLFVFFLKRLYIWGILSSQHSRVGRMWHPVYSLSFNHMPPPPPPAASILHGEVYLVQMMIQHCYIVGIHNPLLFGQTQDAVDPPFWLHGIFSPLYRSCVPPTRPQNL